MNLVLLHPPVVWVLAVILPPPQIQLSPTAIRRQRSWCGAKKKHNLFKRRPRLAGTGEQFTGHNSGSVCAWFWQYVIPFTWTSPFLLLLLLLLILPLVEQTLAPLSVEWNPRAEEHSGPSWPCRSSQSSRTNEFLSLPSLFFSLSLSFNFSWTIQCLSDRRRDGNSSTEGYYSCCCCC